MATDQLPARPTVGQTAADVAEAIRLLAADFRHDELRLIPILPAGARLEDGATYLDLKTFGWKPFRARADQHAEPGQLLVPKADTNYDIWDRLIAKGTP
jgi:hypothetical protein